MHAGSKSSTEYDASAERLMTHSGHQQGMVDVGLRGWPRQGSSCECIDADWTTAGPAPMVGDIDEIEQVVRCGMTSFVRLAGYDALFEISAFRPPRDSGRRRADLDLFRGLLTASADCCGEQA